jgi:predicted small secreted protein
MAMETTMRVLKRLILAILIVTPVAACGTVEGAGKDVSSTSRWIRDKVF